MKATLSMIALLFIWTTSNAQNNSRTSSLNENPTSTRVESEQSTDPGITPIIAVVTQEVDQTNFIYTFVSNKLLSQEKEERWESRFMTTFPAIVDIEISAANQNVVLTLSNTHTSEELLEIVKRFNYSDLEIAN